MLAPASSNIVTTSLWPPADDMTSGVSPPSYTWQREKSWSYISSPTAYVRPLQSRGEKGGNCPSNINITVGGVPPLPINTSYNEFLNMIYVYRELCISSTTSLLRGANCILCAHIMIRIYFMNTSTESCSTPPPLLPPPLLSLCKWITLHPLTHTHPSIHTVP